MIRKGIREARIDFQLNSAFGVRSLAVLTITTLTFVYHPSANASDALLRVHEAFHKALRDADVAELDHLLGDQFVWSHGEGPVLRKSELLKQVRDGKLRYAELKTDHVSFSEYHNAAVVTGHSVRRLADSPKASELRYTLVFVKFGHDWKVTAYHTTILTSGTGQPLQVRLGYPAEAKLLILNADDLAVSHSEDIASFAALDNKFITSATVMVPCPWFTEVAAYAKAHPDIDLGLHLTLTSEWQTYRWGPVSPRALVPSLTGPNGYFYPNAQEF